MSGRWTRRAWLGALLLGLLVSSWLFLAPGDEVPSPGVPFADKVGHLLVFAGLALLAWKAYPTHPRWGIVVALTLYGLAIEIAQRDVPGRAPEALDVVMDAVGAAVVMLMPRRAPPPPQKDEL